MKQNEIQYVHANYTQGTMLVKMGDRIWSQMEFIT